MTVAMTKFNDYNVLLIWFCAASTNSTSSSVTAVIVGASVGAGSILLGCLLCVLYFKYRTPPGEKQGPQEMHAELVSSVVDDSPGAIQISTDPIR
jgi:hypothetical protein